MSAAGDEDSTFSHSLFNDTTTTSFYDDEAIEADESTARYNYLSFIVNACIILPLVVLGLIGNSLSLVFLPRAWPKSVSATILRVLAAVDCFFLVAIFFIGPLPAILQHGQSGSRVPHTVFKYAFPWWCIGYTATLYIAIVAAVFHYITNFTPVKASRLSRVAVAITVALTIGLAVLLNIHLFWYALTDNLIGDVDLIIMSGRFASLLVFLIVPLIALCVLLGLMTCCGRRQNKADDEQEHNDQLTKAFLTIIVLYIVFRLLSAASTHVSYILELLIESRSDITVYVNDASLFLLCLNSALNFIVYCATSGHFRRQTGTCCR